MKKIKEYIDHFRWVIASQRFKKERFKKGGGEGSHHE